MSVKQPLSAVSPFRELTRPEFRRWTAAILAVEVVTVVLVCVAPWVQRALIDAAGAGNGKRTLVAAAIVGAIMLATFAGRSIAGWLRGRLAVEVRTLLKSAMFRHLLNLPEGFLRSKGSGYFFNRMQNDAGEVASFLSGAGLTLWTDAFKIMLACGMIAFMQWRCVLLVLPFVGLQWLVCFRFRQRQFRMSMRLQECAATERHIMQDYLANCHTLKTHDATGAAENRINTGLARWRNLMRKRLVNENYFQCWLQLPVWFCCGGVMLFGLYQVVYGRWTLGELWALLWLLMLVFAPARSLGSGFFLMQSAMAAWARLRDLQHAPGEDDGGEDTAKEVRLNGDIVFSGVDFRYEKEHLLLRKLDFTVASGTIFLLTGSNGSGKSTVLALLLRLYEPCAGVISINGVAASSYPLGAYRSRIGYIGQQPEFFKGTIRDNLLLGTTRSDAEIMDVFRSLECEELIAGRPDGLAAEVGERGENFSGGERLRLALVRELLRDTDILLFDEAAANLDYAGKECFFRLLRNFAGRKTVIATVHELPPDTLSYHILRLPEKEPDATIG